MYQIWLRKSFASESDTAVVVAEQNNRAIGFVTCHLHKPPGEGNIGLVGVAESARGLGCAGGMIQYAARWFAGQGLDRLTWLRKDEISRRSGFISATASSPAQWNCGFTSGLTRAIPCQQRKSQDLDGYD